VARKQAASPQGIQLEWSEIARARDGRCLGLWLWPERWPANCQSTPPRSARRARRGSMRSRKLPFAALLPNRSPCRLTGKLAANASSQLRGDRSHPSWLISPRIAIQRSLHLLTAPTPPGRTGTAPKWPPDRSTSPLAEVGIWPPHSRSTRSRFRSAQAKDGFRVAPSGRTRSHSRSAA